jgi:hypothetical protein
MARVAALLLLAAAARAQSVHGMLTDSMTRAPIPDVIVTLLGPSRYNGTTDQSGVFHIDGVKPGKYVLNILKAGYLLSADFRGSFAIEKDTRLSITMDPLGRVEGRIRYFDGRPAPRASVWLRGVPTGSFLSETADAGGHFVFEDVKPGNYVMHAVSAPGDPKPEGEIWVATWFPSTTDQASAEPIRVGSGTMETRDVRLRSVPARRLRGVVRDEAGQPAAGVTVTLGGGAGGQTDVRGADGAFEFVVYDGGWFVTATRKDGEVELRGGAAVTVARHDVEDATVRLLRPFTLPVVFERDDVPGPDAVFLFPTEPLGPVMRQVKGGVAPVYPGSYRVEIPFAGFGGYLESVRLGDLEVMNKTFSLWDGSQPLRVVIRRGAATVRVTVEKGDGAAVLIVGSDETPRMAMRGPDGSFQLSVRPGDYYVLAFDRADARLLSSPSMWRPLLGHAERVHLEKDGLATVTLKAIPAPQ